MSSPVIVTAYDPAWPQRFAAIAAEVWPAVADMAVAIEHVGSTAVPGLAAKPVIDIDVIVPGAPEVALAIARLSGIGYEHRGDLGVPQREAFRRPPGTAPHNLYVCPRDSPALANHLGVRDYLRAHPDVARSYGALKQQLAQRFAGDIDGYVEAKTPFLLEILQRIGFDERQLAEVERINRQR